nr:DUF3817 domain-containing protein [Williamsia sterculiae]
MANILDLSTTAKRFRFIAVLEAITWLALLISMYFKWVEGHKEAVAVPGMVHGIVFVVFVVVAIWTGITLKWSPMVILAALISSIPPFGTLVFEWWAQRTGNLAELSTTPTRVSAG